MRPIVHADCPHARTRRAARLVCQAVRLSDFRLLGTEVLDLSVKGMLLRSDLAVDVDDEVLVTFKSPVDARWFDLDARVTRVLAGRRRADTRRAVGIAFQAMDPWNEMVLCDHLRSVPLARARVRPRSNRIHVVTPIALA